MTGSIRIINCTELNLDSNLSPDPPKAIHLVAGLIIGHWFDTNRQIFIVSLRQFKKLAGSHFDAHFRKVILKRRLPGKDPAYKRTNLNLLALLQEGDQLQNTLLFDGDTIRVIKADQPVEESIEVASANFSPQVINVNVTGEVEQPGLVNLQANTPLVQWCYGCRWPTSLACEHWQRGADKNQPQRLSNKTALQTRSQPRGIKRKESSAS